MCTFFIEISDECREIKPYIMLEPNLSGARFELNAGGKVESRDISAAKKFPFKYDKSYVKYANIDEELTPTLMTDIYFTLLMYAIEEPTTINITLSNSMPDVFYDLQTIQGNTFLSVLSQSNVANAILQIFMVGEKLEDLENINIYEENTLSFIVNGRTLPSIRKFMPRTYLTDSNTLLIYVDQSDRSVFAYFRIREETTKNCLFEHNVIDVSQVADGETITMANNGTGYCNVTLLNIEKGTVLIKDFWTDSADDPVLFVINDEIILNYTKKNMKSIGNEDLTFGGNIVVNKPSSHIYHINEISITIESDFRSPFSPSLYLVNFLAMITVTPMTGYTEIECPIKKLPNNTWEFSNYNPDTVYANNVHCLTPMSPEDGHGLLIYFDVYHVEEPFDYITIQSTFNDTVVKLSGLDLYSLTDVTFLLEFRSDGNIAYPGFVLQIKQYDCRCKNKIVTIPCSGKKTKYFTDDLEDEHAVCWSSMCSFSVKISSDCSEKKPYVLMENKVLGGRFGLMIEEIHDLQPITEAKKFLFKADEYSVSYINYNDGWVPTRVTDIFFSLDLYAMEEPTFTNATLSESVLEVFYDLRTIQKNNFISVSYENGDNKYLQMFIVNESWEDIMYLNFFDGSIKVLISKSRINPPRNRKFMPRMYRTSSNTLLIYVDQSDRSIFAYFRIREETTKNCLFEHNVIDLSQVADGETITMVNNGTGYCNVTLLNIEKGTVLIKDFWTDSADDPVLFVINDEIILNYTKKNMKSIGSTRLHIGIQHFSIPAQKSFTVIIDRIHIHPNNLTVH
ncbi:hypothetical protein FO519_005599 [Halicephalobus sp. NKZ332]|nr:hypothetical protein FO519_005599 [Halicephalobus sp. NKZ332]